MHTLGPGLFEKSGIGLELPIDTYIFYIDARRDILKVKPECTENHLDSLTTRNYAMAIDRITTPDS